MDLFAQVDNYCEREDFSFWSEPVNAATNAAFLIAAVIAWGIMGGKRDLPARLLCLTLCMIGIGSFLFHTFATGWAAAMDVLPILIFILGYIFMATRRFFGAPLWAGIAAVALYFPFSYVVITGISGAFGTLNGSVSYAPVPILIFGYAAILAWRAPETAKGLAIGASILVASLVFRTVDEAVCPAISLVTHFMWHVLNGIMLGWMIVVLHRHHTPLR